jgi:Tfp pilus assembly protein PilN
VIQQVNLYREILKQQQKQSGIKLYSMALAAVVLLCVGFSAYLLWDLGTIETEVHQAQLTFDQEQARVNDMLSKRPSQEPNLSTLTEIEQWQNRVNEASQTLKMLTGKGAVSAQGFSGYLQALANQSDPDVWITAIHINGQNQGLSIEGSTFKPEQIPQLLQQLQKEPAFKGQTFAKLIMQLSAKIAGQMDFTLSSTEQPLTVKDHAQ